MYIYIYIYIRRRRSYGKGGKGKVLCVGGGGLDVALETWAPPPSRTDSWVGEGWVDRQPGCARPNTHLNTLQSEKEEEGEEAGERQDLRGHGLLQTRLFLRRTHALLHGEAACRSAENW